MEDITPSALLEGVIGSIADKNRISAGIMAMRERETGFRSALERDLAGIAAIPAARSEFISRLRDFWDDSTTFRIAQSYASRELIIGSGPHAAAYAATRVREGFPRPFIAEKGAVGGAFSAGPFLLNSRNRPGSIGLPDQDTALNDIAGGVIQPSMVTADEYPSSTDMEFCTLATLAQYGYVMPHSEVTNVESLPGGRIEVYFGSKVHVFGRVIDARGCGDPAPAEGNKIISFPAFMNRMRDMNFPLQGLGRVAVIGGGNSGACAAESCLGIAPSPHMSAIGLDYVRRVDWYTGGDVNATCEETRAGSRGRYVRLGQCMEGNISSPTVRLGVYPDFGYPARAGDMVTVNDRTYDLAVVCTGNTLPGLGGVELDDYQETVRAGENGYGSVIARKLRRNWYAIGPAAGIEFSATERRAEVVGSNQANKVAMFRLMPKTAALATMLPGLEESS